jgi:hypothetical protein
VRAYEPAELRNAVKAKMAADMREQLKKVATEYLHTNEPGAIVQGMRITAKYAEGADVLYVTIHQGVLVFSCKERTEQEWVARVNELSKKELATPRKVLIKSVALRMEKMRKEIDRENTWRIKEGRGTPYTTATDLSTSQAVHEYVKLLESQRATASIKVKANELLEFFRRDDLDDSVIHDAWGIVVAREVMES